ncbi:MAG: hypothetical protein UX00_C0002G0002 [Microgenomates group bacterium GW2011_GWB1_45_17]|nr:MAG: hypothetical protein UX00_C0002G0002 [Microgenomates group bacterium GW2011_GWB1_45_17]KKU23741.1 MAG: hypothetical protein UX36_C0003G0041 [Microgenomates group bacterium GW2011_GWC1_46_15]
MPTLFAKGRKAVRADDLPLYSLLVSSPQANHAIEEE